MAEEDLQEILHSNDLYWNDLLISSVGEEDIFILERLKNQA